MAQAAGGQVESEIGFLLDSQAAGQEGVSTGYDQQSSPLSPDTGGNETDPFGLFPPFLDPSVLNWPLELTDGRSTPTEPASDPPNPTLTEAEREALDWYQNQATFGFASKPVAWSTLAILMKTALRSPSVFHLLLAASLAEISCDSPSRWSMLFNAEDHYRKGRELLEGVIQDPNEDPVTVLACFWFLYLHQRRRQFGDKIRYGELSELMAEYFQRSQLHQKLSSPEPEAEHTELEAEHTPKSGEYPALSPNSRALLARLTVWLFGIDAQSCACGEGGSLARLIYQSVSTDGVLGMFETSREALRLHQWDVEYPDDQVVDDLKNASALELLHHVWSVLHEVNEAAETCPVDPVWSRQIRSKLDAMRKKYPISSVFRLTESRTAERDRLMANSDWAVANYYAVCIYHFRCSLGEEECGFDSDAGIPIAETTAALKALVQRALQAPDKNQIGRMQWPLFWLGIETTDRWQTWIMCQMDNRVLRDALQAILLQQMDGTRASMRKVREICRWVCDQE